MGYARALLVRWSRRDRLAVVVVALTVAFLTGAALLFVATTAQTTALAAEYTTQGTIEYYDSVDAAHEAAAESDVVLSAAAITRADGTPTYVLGVSPTAANRITTQTDSSLPPPPASGVSRGAITTPRRQTLSGTGATATVQVQPRRESRTILTATWYVGSPELVDRLGPTGAFVITPASAATTDVPVRGAPLRSALAFFLAGTRQFLGLFGLLTGGAGVLIGVTTYSVTRMTVHDRVRTIRIIRATGGTPGHVRRLFASRALGLVTVGILLGYAGGVILPNIAVNVAVFLGLPTSLSLTVSPAVTRLLAPTYLGVAGLGYLSGYLATWLISRRPPAQLQGTSAPNSTSHTSLRALVLPGSVLGVLDWRPLVPTVATLTVFLTALVLLATAIGVIGPAVAGSGTTITETGASHPIASELPAASVDALRAQGVPASGEILVFSVTDGQPFLVRGATYRYFANVSNATLTAGHPPQAPQEAIIGTDLARSLDLEIGDSLVLGGSTRAGFTRVTIVGRYTAQGPFDDQLLVPLGTARDLSTIRPGGVQFIRTTTTPADQGTPKAGVVDVSTPDRVVANQSTPVTLTLINTAPDARNTTVTVQLGPTSTTTRVSLAPGATHTETVTLDAPSPGNYTLHVGNITQEVSVVDPDALVLQGLPPQVPPGSAPQTRVVTAAGQPVTNATITVGDQRTSTGPTGTTRIPFEEAGEYTVRVQHAGQTTTKRVRVTPTADRGPQVSVRPQPRQPGLLSDVTAVATIRNPWETRQEWTLTLHTPTGELTQTVTLDPGAQTSLRYPLGRLSPGEYQLVVATANQSVATTTVTVSGDERLVSALATQGQRTGGSTLGRAITVLFGNLNLLVGVLVGLAGFMTVGSITAVFAHAIATRRQTLGIYRATGASPTRILQLVLQDALLIGSVGTLAALGLTAIVLQVLGARGLLTVFGIRFTPTLTPTMVAASLVGALIVVLAGAVLATGAILWVEPRTLLQD